MTTVYLDESGYTGEDLIQPDQPVFVICTHSIDEASCAALKARHFTDVKATELKHSRLAGRPRQAKMLIAALKDLAMNYGEQILVGISDKRYSLLSVPLALGIVDGMRVAARDYGRPGRNIRAAIAGVD